MAFWLRRQARPPKRYTDDQVGIWVDEDGNLQTVTDNVAQPVGGEGGPHDHDEAYAPVVHAHEGGGDHPNLAGHTALGLAAEHSHDFAADVHTHPTHDHDADYSASGHTHDTSHDHTGTYAPDAHSHAVYATDTDLSDHAATTHGMSAHAIDGVYHTGASVLPSTGEKNALAGTTGTPGTTNRYVTDADSRLSDARVPTTHSHDYSASSHTHVIADGDIPAAIARDAEVTSAIATHAATPHGGGEAGGEAFPVGSVFLSVVSTNPGTLLGYGTWSAFGQGRMLLGWNTGDTDEATGGAATHTHAAHADVINHTHGVTVTDPGHDHVENSNNATTGPLRGWGAADTSTNTSTATGYSTSSATTGISATTADPAGGVASLTHDSPNHMPPFVVVRMWKRTA